ncbi:tRNA-splicing endonuclease subunit [Meyerozyma sp. JA9]|nr:tRNA-splicing endonuclease subunit [Meyerozyma sp. JA9]
MSKSTSKSHLYRNPLPLLLSSDHYGPAPNLIPHNPLSWVVFGWWYVSTICKPVPHQAVQVVYEDHQFKVYDDVDIARLWQSGFFGKGTLSRSDPSWKVRTIRRLGLNDPDGVAGFSSEDVTKQRREERRRFKHERARVQQLELAKRQGMLSEQDNDELVELQEKLKAWRHQATVAVETPVVPAELRPEDEALLEPGTRNLKANIEYLQLQPVEFFFLYFALGAVQLSPPRSFADTVNALVPTPSASSTFLVEYAVYHHYRSLGWCVRSGIKFGCDMLLYKRGPPFSHAEFAIKICTTEPAKPEEWSNISALARVVGGVKKTLVLVYVDVPNEAGFRDQWHNVDSTEGVLQLINSYKITEILYKRWVPSRTRD